MNSFRVLSSAAKHGASNVENSPRLAETRGLVGPVGSPVVSRTLPYSSNLRRKSYLALFLLLKVHGLFIIKSKHQNHQEIHRELVMVSSFPTALAAPGTAGRSLLCQSAALYRPQGHHSATSDCQCPVSHSYWQSALPLTQTTASIQDRPLVGRGHGEARFCTTVLSHFALPKERESARRNCLYGALGVGLGGRGCRMEKAEAAREDQPESAGISRLHLQTYRQGPAANLGGGQAVLLQTPGPARQGWAGTGRGRAPTHPQLWRRLTLLIYSSLLQPRLGSAHGDHRDLPPLKAPSVLCVWSAHAGAEGFTKSPNLLSWISTGKIQEK